MHAAVSFPSRMSSIATTLERSPADALALAESLERDLLSAPSTDPTEFGWARDYRIRALYRLGRHAEGLSILMTPPPRAMTISAKNAAWLHSVGAEMALRTGAVGQVRALISRALALRIASRDPTSCNMAVETGFTLLREGGRPEEVDAWLSHVEAQIAASTDPAIAMAMADALANAARAPWFPGALPSAERRRAEMALHRAAADGRVDEVRRRLAEGVDVDARHPAWPGLPTPLLAASFHGHTPLHVAAWQDHRDCVRVLLTSGADLEVRDVNGDTALALAATEPVPEVVRALVRAGADVEAVNAYGQTPLIRAATEGQAATATALIEAGADTLRCDHQQRTALDRARSEGHRELVKLLRRLSPRHH